MVFNIIGIFIVLFIVVMTIVGYLSGIKARDANRMIDKRTNRRSSVSVTPETRRTWPTFVDVRSRLLVVVARSRPAAYFVSILARATSAQETSSCIACHSDLERPSVGSGQIVRARHSQIKRPLVQRLSRRKSGKSDKDGAKDKNYGYVGKPTAQQIPAFCGKCHSDADLMKKFNPSLRVDQVQEYATSVHGNKLSGRRSEGCHLYQLPRGPRHPGAG